MREYDDDDNIRLYAPVLQRVIILAAVVIAVPVMIVVLGIRIGIEERTLRANLEGYTEYMQRVPYRLIPFVW